MHDLKPTRADSRIKSLGKWLTGSGVLIVVLLVVVAVLATTVSQQSAAIGRLSGALSGQRDQFDACKGKPAATKGCTTPIAAEPSVIVKQGKQGPIGLTGEQGQPGPVGPAGPQGSPGPVGPTGKQGPAGKSGSSPACLLLVSACSGPQGLEGKQGPAGPAGKDGEQGPAGPQGEQGPAGVQGPQGEMGVQGSRGVSVSSTQCVDDETTTGSHWLITYTDATSETSPGPCRVKLP